MMRDKEALVTFREFTSEVLNMSWKWLNDPEIKELTLTPDLDRESQQSWFKSLQNKHDYFICSIWLNEEPIGVCGIKHLTSTDGEVWYYIGEKQFWGKGIGTQMMQYLIEYAELRDLESIYAKLLKENISSYKLCEKFNFKVEKQIDENLIIMRLCL